MIPRSLVRRTELALMLKGYRIYTYLTKSVAFPANTVKDTILLWSTWSWNFNFVFKPVSSSLTNLLGWYNACTMYFFLSVQNVNGTGKFSQRTSVLFEDSMGEDLLSLLFQSFLLYLARLVCLASHQSLTKFWLTLPTVAGVPGFIWWECGKSCAILHRIHSCAILHRIQSCAILHRIWSRTILFCTYIKVFPISFSMPVSASFLLSLITL